MELYMISSIIMDGAEDRKTLDEAREIVKSEAIKLLYDKIYGNTSDGWVHIDKYNNETDINTCIESWKYDNKNFRFLKQIYESLLTVSENKFYNFLQNEACKAHNKTWETFGTPEWATVKEHENFIGEVIHEYIKVYGKPKVTE
jgi:hypothetical protein